MTAMQSIFLDMGQFILCLQQPCADSDRAIEDKKELPRHEVYSMTMPIFSKKKL